jgi:hypothetical protein
VAEPNVAFEHLHEWLPVTNVPTESKPLAELWVGQSPRPPMPAGPPRRIYRFISLRVDEVTKRGIALGRTGHARLNLRQREGHVQPGSTPTETDALLTLSAAALLARASVLLLDATAIVDRTGGGWLLLGHPVERTALACAFASEGWGFVSDGQLLVRRTDPQPSRVVLESWHRGPRLAADRADLVASAATLLSPQRWRPVAELRGVLIARASPSGEDAPWRRVPRDEVMANLAAASPYLHSDHAVEEYLGGLLASCADCPALDVFLDSATSPGLLEPGRRLTNVLEQLIH